MTEAIVASVMEWPCGITLIITRLQGSSGWTIGSAG
jgi:hypothetical protein